MTQHSSDHLLCAYYKGIDGRHDKLRGELLDKLCDTQVVARPGRPSVTRIWLPSFRLVSAAIVLLAVGLLIFASRGSTQPAYGLENLAERLATIHSLHLKGWMYQKITSQHGEEKIEKFPTELYAKRPSTIGYRTYGFSTPGGGKPSTVSSGFMAINRDRTIYVSHNEKNAIIAETSGDDFQTELMVEAFVQSSMAEKFLLGPPEHYRKIRSEILEEIPCDLYEYAQCKIQPAGYHRIWLNQLTGIPVKYESGTVDEEGVEQVLTSEVMQIDVEPPASLFSFEPPEGYEVTQAETKKPATAGARLQRFGEGGSDSTWLSAWHCLKVNDQSVLACWYQYDIADGEKSEFSRQPEFILQQGDQTRACREHTISTNSREDSHWRWSLIFPVDSEPLGQCTLRIKLADEKTSTFQELQPLSFPRERLQEILAEAQRRTLPEESQQELFTMKDLESLE